MLSFMGGTYDGSVLVSMAETCNRDKWLAKRRKRVKSKQVLLGGNISFESALSQLPFLARVPMIQ